MTGPFQVHVRERQLSQGRAEVAEQKSALVTPAPSSPVVLCKRTKMEGNSWVEEGEGNFHSEVTAQETPTLTVCYSECVSEYRCVRCYLQPLMSQSSSRHFAGDPWFFAGADVRNGHGGIHTVS